MTERAQNSLKVTLVTADSRASTIQSQALLTSSLGLLPHLHTGLVLALAGEVRGMGREYPSISEQGAWRSHAGEADRAGCAALSGKRP